MNLRKLKQAEADFLNRYPGGFNHEEMQVLGKKHKMAKMVELTQDVFSPLGFEKQHSIIDDLIKVISRSSMVSMFEKPKFKEFAKTLTGEERELMMDALQARLHGDEQQGFELMVDIMLTRKLAKWSLISICPLYFEPQREVFVKPTTVKKIIEILELEKLQYSPLPTWEFYSVFRDTINEMKTKVDKSLSPNNAAFTGFLMMSL